jgi:hypothetical protein
MGHPVGPLLATLAGRILDNLDVIDRMAPAWGSARQNAPPFSDTQLLISLLGVLIFPHEAAPEALGKLLRGYEPMRQVLSVVYSRRTGGRIEIADADGEPVLIDPTRLQNLPGLLRNSVAHFNMLPLESGGRFSGVRIWNRAPDGEITFVADMDFDGLRSLARHILRELRDQRDDLDLHDPEDPMIEVEASRQAAVPARPRVPKLNGDIWIPFVVAHGGDAGAAKMRLDRWMRRETERLARDASSERAAGGSDK